MHSLRHLLFIVPIIVGVVLVVLVMVAVLVRRSRHLAKLENLRLRWETIQQDCRKSEQWPACIIEADKLLDEALRAAGFRGRTMGERLVAAQRALSDNDGVWFGHKLRNKIEHEEIRRLYKRDVKTALMGLRKALQDLGAL